MSAMDVLRASGRRVPEDVAVIGDDNLSIAEVANPPLTTVSQNLPQAGKGRWRRTLSSTCEPVW